MQSQGAPPSCLLYPTIVTPFLGDRSIDYDSLSRLISLFARCGCDGVFAVCQSSEMFFLTNDEKLALAEFCIEACHARGMRCVVSGHTQDALDAQVAYLQRLEALSPDAVILVSNRLATPGEDDLILIGRLQLLTGALRPETALGIYECPYPYKRLLTQTVLDALITDGRFIFLKDTCCDPQTLRRRLALLRGTPLQLLNANSATLLDSLLHGAAGYSGTQLNFIPEIFALLRDRLAAGDLDAAETTAAYISATSMTGAQSYPGNAKYYLSLRNILQGDTVPNPEKAPLSPSQRLSIEAFLRLNSMMEAHLRAGGTLSAPLL